MSTNYDVNELLDEMGSGLRSEVLLFLDRHLISKIPFFQGKVPQFVADTISMFQPMVFQENDYICKEGTQADEMFFLIRGKAGIYYGEKLVVVIDEGSYFGEIGCIMGGIRRAGVKALTTCELQALSRRNLNILLAEYPEVGDELKTVARNRASIAKRGKQEETVSQVESSELEIAKNIEANVPIAVPPSLIATPSPLATDARYMALVEKEVERITTAIGMKIRNGMGLVAQPHEGVT
jgi:CRP-like cAMP-binding protein